ncbi:hypothetical protein BDN67DRAFT_1045015 [Paxillus ammoniavirescens]|nr:hypothetical protein BDN67DRAFT_1045015 [Paxillus ammoniavirescens]
MLPPGPPASWFWDSPLPASKQLPSKVLAHTFEDWVAEYSPVMSIRQGSQVAVVIGCMEDIGTTEIMEKKGWALVNRPCLITFGEIMSGVMRMPAANGFIVS